MKIGVFGGAFNPVHNGHVNLAQKFTDFLDLEKMIVVPTSNPPHRVCSDFAPAKARIDMLNAAFSGNDKIIVSDIEFRRNTKSYTYDTIIELKKLFPAAEFYLIVGQDQFLKFTEWYNYSSLLNEVVLCTAARERDSRDQLYAFAREHLNGARVFIAEFEPVVVSSSEIRDKIKKNIDISGLVPKGVLDYINEKGLYRDGF